MKYVKIALIAVLSVCLVACSKPQAQLTQTLPYSAEELVAICTALTNQVYSGEIEQMVDSKVLQTLSPKTYEDSSAFAGGTYQDILAYVGEYFTDFEIEQYLYSSDNSVAILVSYNSGTTSYYYVTGTLVSGVFTDIKIYDGLDTIK